MTNDNVSSHPFRLLRCDFVTQKEANERSGKAEKGPSHHTFSSLWLRAKKSPERELIFL
jgi:hypothetical protein